VNILIICWSFPPLICLRIIVCVECMHIFSLILLNLEVNHSISKSCKRRAHCDMTNRSMSYFPLAGGTCTWSNNQENPSWSRLDRFLVSPNWEVKFPGSIQKRLPRLCSDHFSILLDCGGIQWSSRPFKFENMWLKAEGFVDRVRLWWASYRFQGSPSFIFTQKLKALKADLKRWNEQEFGNVEFRKKMHMEELCTLDRLEEQQGLSSEEKERKCVVIRDLENSILQEEISWSQKSRVLWLKEGDKCTKFFHQIANSNRRSNSIESLSITGSISSDQQVIRNMLLNSMSLSL
jgi:hypothetical protein